MIMSGDQYGLKVLLNNDGEIVTPDNCDGVKIKVGHVTKIYPVPTGETYDPALHLTFDDIDKRWIYTLLQAETLKYHLDTPIQAQVDFGDEILSTRMKPILIGESIIDEEW